MCLQTLQSILTSSFLHADDTTVCLQQNGKLLTDLYPVSVIGSISKLLHMKFMN
jgi:hypothetical protein